MLSSKLEKFVAKRVIILLVLLSILDLLLLNHKVMILLGLVLGTIFSILKFGSMASMYSVILNRNLGNNVVQQSTIRYILNQFVTVMLLIVSINLSLFLFIGVTAGVLSVPLVIFVNGITEGLGITHNNFE